MCKNIFDTAKEYEDILSIIEDDEYIIELKIERMLYLLELIETKDNNNKD